MHLSHITLQGWLCCRKGATSKWNWLPLQLSPSTIIDILLLQLIKDSYVSKQEYFQGLVLIICLRECRKGGRSTWNWLPLKLSPSISNLQCNFKPETSRKNLWLALQEYFKDMQFLIPTKKKTIKLELIASWAEPFYLKFPMEFQTWDFEKEFIARSPRIFQRYAVFNTN